MKNIFAAGFGLLASLSAHAEVITCSFTEPFVTLTYNTATQLLVEKDDGTGHKRALRNVSFQIQGPGQFVLSAANGKELAKLELNNEGSDGMSETVYPYSVNYGKMLSRANGGVGGCSSTLLPAKSPAN